MKQRCCGAGPPEARANRRLAHWLAALHKKIRPARSKVDDSCGHHAHTTPLPPNTTERNHQRSTLQHPNRQEARFLPSSAKRAPRSAASTASMGRCTLRANMDNYGTAVAGSVGGHMGQHMVPRAWRMVLERLTNILQLPRRRWRRWPWATSWRISVRIPHRHPVEEHGRLHAAALGSWADEMDAQPLPSASGSGYSARNAQRGAGGDEGNRALNTSAWERSAGGVGGGRVPGFGELSLLKRFDCDSTLTPHRPSFRYS